jgi:hypothetical protein
MILLDTEVARQAKFYRAIIRNNSYSREFNVQQWRIILITSILFCFIYSFCFVVFFFSFGPLVVCCFNYRNWGNTLPKKRNIFTEDFEMACLPSNSPVPVSAGAGAEGPGSPQTSSAFLNVSATAPELESAYSAECSQLDA